DHALELRVVDEVVVLCVALAGTWRPRGERDRQADIAVARQAGIDDARLPGARGCRDDEQRPARLVAAATQCSAPVRGPGRSTPSAPRRCSWCGRRPTWSPGCWPRG